MKRLLLILALFSAPGCAALGELSELRSSIVAVRQEQDGLVARLQTASGEQVSEIQRRVSELASQGAALETRYGALQEETARKVAKGIDVAERGLEFIVPLASGLLPASLPVLGLLQGLLTLLVGRKRTNASA